MQIETERLLIRTIQPGDVEVLARLWSDPAVTRHMGGARDYSKMVEVFSQDAADDPQPPFDLWVTTEKASGRFIGHCGITEKEVDGVLEYELVYVLAVEAWGKDYATEAARGIKAAAVTRFGLTRLIALIEPENEGSRRVAEKAGFHFEKETLRPDGKYRRVYSIALDAPPGLRESGTDQSAL
jgi:RimJ/RimL family protein N-acetyltransferase